MPRRPVPPARLCVRARRGAAPSRSDAPAARRRAALAAIAGAFGLGAAVAAAIALLPAAFRRAPPPPPALEDKRRRRDDPAPGTLERARRAARENAERADRAGEALEAARAEARGATARADAAEAELRGALEEARAAGAALEAARARPPAPPPPDVALERAEAAVRGATGTAELAAIVERLGAIVAEGSRRLAAASRRRAYECAVCLAERPEEAMRALVPCMHGLCAACAARILAGGPRAACPRCRGRVQRAQRVFLDGGGEEAP